MFSSKNSPFLKIIITISLITILFAFKFTSSNFYRYLYNSFHTVISIGVFLTIMSCYSTKKQNSLLLVCYLSFIAIITLLNREPATRILRLNLSHAIYQILKSSVVRKESLYNTILFIPLGSMVSKLFPSKKAYILPLIISAIIEISQFVFKIGWCEIIDFLSNGLGGIIGILVCSLYKKLLSI